MDSRYSAWCLFIGSAIFYGIGEPIYVVLLITSVIINYFMNQQMMSHLKYRKYVSKDGTERSRRKKGKYERHFKIAKYWFVTIVILNLLILFFFKYYDFTVGNINLLIGNEFLPVLKWSLPIGISFYTFQMLSYQIDCYMGRQTKRASLEQFGAYVCMFPQLIAGPIVQYHEVEDQLTHKRITAENLEDGLQYFTIGLTYKVLLANQVGTLWNTIAEIGAAYVSTPIAWLGAFAYSFQIYFDFWGYSLMAVGLGMMFGFHLPENFNHPYISKSATEFWRRWHITLGRFFREYVYIPLGGNRKGMAVTIRNLLVVWILTGLWHGASWNFVIWGLLFFVLLSIERIGVGKWLEKHALLGHLYVVFIIPISWIVFAIDDLDQLIIYLKSMFGIHIAQVMTGQIQLVRYVERYAVLLIACMIMSMPFVMKIYDKFKTKIWMKLLLLVCFWYSVYLIYSGANNPFLYFRF